MIGWISIDPHGEEEEGEEKAINGVGVEMQKANPSIVCKCIPYKRSIEDQFGSLNPTCVWKISEELSETYAIDVGRKKMPPLNSIPGREISSLIFQFHRIRTDA
ncbi:hypothetical protein ACS0TY_004902 [Phlomoides rotata]